MGLEGKIENAEKAVERRVVAIVRRVLWVLLHAHLLPITFVAGAVIAVVLHMNTPILRRVIASRVGAILASSFKASS